MAVIERPGSPFWNVEFEIDTIRHRGPTPFLLDYPNDRKRRGKNYKLAKELEGALKIEIRANQAKGLPVRRPGEPPEVLPEMSIRRTFADYLESQGPNLADAEKIKANLDRMANYFISKGIRSLFDISDPEIEDLIMWRRQHTRWDRPGERQISMSTVNRTTVCSLQPVFSWAKAKRRTAGGQKVKFPDEPEWKNHTLAEPTERVRELREDEDEALFAAETDPDYEVWRQFALRSGLRLRNTLLKWSQVDLRARSVTLITKGDKVTTLPLSAEAMKLIRTRIGHHKEYVFTIVSKRDWPHRRKVKGQRYPIVYRSAQGHWREQRARAAEQCPSLVDPTGRLSYRFHDNRHTMATRLLRETGKLKVVQKALGHSHIATTAKYAHVSTDEIRAGLDEAEKAYPAPTTTKPGGTGQRKEIA